LLHKRPQRGGGGGKGSQEEPSGGYLGTPSRKKKGRNTQAKKEDVFEGRGGRKTGKGKKNNQIFMVDKKREGLKKTTTCCNCQSTRETKREEGCGGSV